MKKKKEFTKLFPSLKGKGTRVCDYMSIVKHTDKLRQYLNEQVAKALLSDFTYTQNQIEENCLDKKRVRDAIDELKMKSPLKYLSNYNKALEDLKQELNLEEEK